MIGPTSGTRSEVESPGDKEAYILYLNPDGENRYCEYPHTRLQLKRNYV